MTPSQETKVLILEGMAHDNRKAGQAYLALAIKQEDQAYDLEHGEGEAARIRRNMEVWND